MYQLIYSSPKTAALSCTFFLPINVLHIEGYWKIKNYSRITGIKDTSSYFRTINGVYLFIFFKIQQCVTFFDYVYYIGLPG